jgi:plasmid maintenance system antidote protein VapI
MYPNLEVEMLRKKITNKALARIIGVSDKTIQNKMHGETEFTLPEAMAIMELFPEFNLSYLFEKKSA